MSAARKGYNVYAACYNGYAIQATPGLCKDTNMSVITCTMYVVYVNHTILIVHTIPYT